MKVFSSGRNGCNFMNANLEHGTCIEGVCIKCGLASFSFQICQITKSAKLNILFILFNLLLVVIKVTGTYVCMYVCNT